MKKTIKLSDDLIEELKKEKGDATYDDIIRRWKIAYDTLSPNMREVLSLLDSPAERGVFLVGYLFGKIFDRNRKADHKLLSQIKILSSENFGRVYAAICNQLIVNDMYVELEPITEMASRELLVGNVKRLSSDEMRYVFSLGESFH